MMLQKNLKFKWVVLHGVEVSTPYGIDEGTVSTYGFVYPANHDVKTGSTRRKWFLIEQSR